MNKLESYKRDIDPIRHYKEQAAHYISVKKNIPYEVALAKVQDMISKREGLFSKVVDREVTFTNKLKNGDREISKAGIYNYLMSAVKNDDIIAPTFTVYTNPNVLKSFLTDQVIENKAIRAAAKKKKFEMQALGKIVEADIYSKVDTNKKIFNNSQSGAMSSSSTPLYNKTGHSTLTSGCRNTSSFGNCNNEKFLCGNRHYFSLNVTLNNLNYIAKTADESTLSVIVEKYFLHIPTVDEVFLIVKKSTNFYYLDSAADKTVYEFIEKVTPLQRVWIAYANDFYHLATMNPDIIKSFIREATTKVTFDGEYTVADLKRYDENLIILGHSILFDEVKGMGTRYDEMAEKGILKTLIPTIDNSMKTLIKYSDLLSCFFKNALLPHNVADFPKSIRKAVVGSDTDSSLFTVKDLVYWYKGNELYDVEARATQGLLIMLVSETVAHILAQMSKNFGIATESLKDIYMKNEYTFDVFVNTLVSKHYYATKSIQEGNVFSNVEREYKGVQLINGKLPLFITASARGMMDSISDSVISNKKIKLTEYLNLVLSIEKKIEKSILSGDISFFKTVNIKQHTSYNTDNFNAYQHYVLWDSVFSPKYGTVAAPPYASMKISTTLNNKTSLAEWVNSIEDIDLKQRLAQWIVDKGRNDLNMILLSKDYISSNGIPKEILPVVDIKGIISELCHALYMILNTIGYQIKDGFILSDFYNEV